MRPASRLFSFLLALSTSAPATAPAGDCVPIPKPAEPPGFDEFVVLPLRVHVLSSADLPDVDCALADADIKRVLDKVNGIWHQAGVHWALESIAREPAARQGRFKAAMEADPADKLGVFRMLVPEGSRSGRGMDVFYIHKFSVNGVYLGDRLAFVQETAQLRAVPGGIDEPLPRVTAHELGHALGLPHRQDKTNLLASGTTGTTLNDAEVATARVKAKGVPGALTAPEIRQKADEALAKGDKAEARSLLATLAELPGEPAAEARRKLDEIAEKEKN